MEWGDRSGGSERRRTREGSKEKEEGKTGRRRARGHFWKEEEAEETREKEKGGYREGERPEKGGEREESDSDSRQPSQKQRSAQRPKPRAFPSHLAAVRFLSEQPL